MTKRGVVATIVDDVNELSFSGESSRWPLTERGERNIKMIIEFRIGVSRVSRAFGGEKKYMVVGVL